MYNNAVYNSQQYNANTFSTVLAESITGADALATVTDFNRLLAEAAPLIDSLSFFFNQVDEFNLDYFSPTDTAAIQFNKSLVDAATANDSPVVIAFVKALLDTMSLADLVKLAHSTTLIEATVLTDTITKSITNKGLSDMIRLQDWIGLKRTGNDWSD